MLGPGLGAIMNMLLCVWHQGTPQMMHVVKQGHAVPEPSVDLTCMLLPIQHLIWWLAGWLPDRRPTN